MCFGKHLQSILWLKPEVLFRQMRFIIRPFRLVGGAQGHLGFRNVNLFFLVPTDSETASGDHVFFILMSA